MVKWRKANERLLLERLVEEWGHLTGQQKLEMMLVAPEPYFAVERLVRYHNTIKRLEAQERERGEERT